MRTRFNTTYLALLYLALTGAVIPSLCMGMPHLDPLSMTFYIVGLFGGWLYCFWKATLRKQAR